MEFQRVHLGRRPRNHERWRTLAVLGAAAALLATAAAPARADTMKTPGDPQIDPDPASATTFAETADALTLTRPASAGAPGYTLTIAKQPFELTTSRGGATVLATTGDADTRAAARFVSGGTSYHATGVASASWAGGVLTLDLTTDDPGYDIAYKVTPKADRYAIHWDVADPRTTSSVGGDFSLASAGHWYGQGIAVTQQGGPYGDQPWPLDSGHVSDHQLGPFDYFVNDPYWFTSSSTGMWVNTDDVMFVDINASTNAGVGSFLVTNNTRSNDGSTPNPSTVGESRSYDAVMFVESTPRDGLQRLHRDRRPSGEERHDARAVQGPDVEQLGRPGAERHPGVDAQLRPDDPRREPAGPHDGARRRLGARLRRPRVQQHDEVPRPEGDDRPDPRHGLRLRPLGLVLLQPGAAAARRRCGPRSTSRATCSRRSPTRSRSARRHRAPPPGSAAARTAGRASSTSATPPPTPGCSASSRASRRSTASTAGSSTPACSTRAASRTRA